MIRTYASKQVKLFMGVVQIEGFTDNSAITITENDNLISKFVGIDGEVALAYNSNNSATVRVSLYQTSHSNGIFGVLASAKLILPFSVVDMSGTSLHFSLYSIVSDRPVVVYDSNINERVWTIECLDLDNIIGGN